MMLHKLKITEYKQLVFMHLNDKKKWMQTVGRTSKDMNNFMKLKNAKRGR